MEKFPSGFIIKMANQPKIPGIFIVLIALVLLSSVLFLKERNVFSVFLYESDETNVADRINWTNEITFITDPTIGNVTSCSLYISSTGAELDQVIHDRDIFYDNETGLYMWCDDTDSTVIISPLFNDVDLYFKTFFSSKEVECIENSDCSFIVDSDCDREPDAFEQCVNYHCVTPQIECACYVGDDTCKLSTTTDNDCSLFYTAEDITYDGVCQLGGVCSYPSYNARDTYTCSSFQYWAQKPLNKIYMFVGLIVIIGGIYFYNKRK